MKFYETMYIVHPILEMGRLHDLILDIEKNLSEKGGEVVFTNVIGKKRMAYPIQKQKFGTYVLIQFKSDGSKNNNFSFEMEHNPNVLRHMIINIDESHVQEQTEEVKDQISGLSRPNSNSSEEKSEDTETAQEVKDNSEETEIKSEENTDSESTEEETEAVDETVTEAVTETTEETEE